MYHDLPPCCVCDVAGVSWCCFHFPLTFEHGDMTNTNVASLGHDFSSYTVIL